MTIHGPLRQKNALLMLAAVTVLAGMVSSGSRIAIPLFAVKLGASPLLVGLILGSYALLPALTAIAIGRWIDRVGVRFPMRIAATTMALGQFVAWMFPGMLALALNAACIGISMATFMISMQHSAGALGDASNRTSIFSWMTICQSLALMVSPPITGFLIDHLGHRDAFLCLGLLGVMLLALLLVADRLLPSEAKASAPIRRRVMDLLQYPAVRAALVISALSPIGWELFFFFVPLHGASIGLSASTIGLVFSAFSMSIFAIRLAVPWLSRRASEWTLIAVAMGTAGVMFLLFPLAQDAAMLVMLSVVLGAGMGISQPITLSIIYTVAPEGRRSELAGVRTTSINSAQIAAPLMLGALSASMGLAFAVWPFAILLLAGCRFAYRRTAALEAGKS